VFAYSQWTPRLDPHASTPPLHEFFPPEAHLLDVTASRTQDGSAPVVKVGETLTHLAEFRMAPGAQAEMITRTTEALDQAFDVSPGLVSATFHRSLDGTRMFNYGQWTSEEAFAALESQPGFSKDAPYWEGLAKNEFHLYKCVHVIDGDNLE